MDIETNMIVFVVCLLLLAFLSTCVATKKRKEQSTTTSTKAAALRKGDVAVRLYHAPSLGSVAATDRAAVVPGPAEPAVNDAAPRSDHMALVQLLPSGDYMAFNVSMAKMVDLHARVVQHVIEKTNNWLLVGRPLHQIQIAPFF